MPVELTKNEPVDQDARKPESLEPTPVYDQMIAERGGRPPGVLEQA